MFRKEEKQALTRLALLSVGWGLGLDRFYDGRIKDGFLSIIGWGLIFAGLFYFSPCHGIDYTDGAKTYSEMSPNPLAIFPIGLGTYGAVLIIRKAFKLLRSFETSE
ncbi:MULTISPECIES: hypothetical protein [Prochlorococcus]|uniref:TM2 domain-containing protein n=1 Tax=Prochlorococcus marinus (strain SARG / CCMP1375 / SS120) TaxID=167539 RepID=Q7VBA2_PROMA|nr:MULTISPECIES: hypothetical protein [Prochlorococcus]AAQ00240.1 Predicted protein [Prochlorococcus marinus subsp. marinus str. CCMP1375]KGG14041.1 hypothetical protein EV04_0526 [Prochlorococcus marinus str. LG]KGG19173.1 hypothetical protein EV08_1660 [Prochlorococcus marinus str. SS2]KGG23286.1 hypothetical protein EV09_0910 [Prochlorococcus marinus str. SS35]KGG32479.1 hypothetical protein EV10_1594 [Prochlorococcus marinus str. SS51]